MKEAFTTLLYLYRVVPSKLVQPGNISQFPHRAVRFGWVETNLPAIARSLFYQLRHIPDSDLFSRTYINMCITDLFFRSLSNR